MRAWKGKVAKLWVPGRGWEIYQGRECGSFREESRRQAELEDGEQGEEWQAMELDK